MTGPASRVAAIDIGESVVRVVECEVRQTEVRIVKLGSAPAPRGYWSDPSASRDELAQALRRALGSAGIGLRQVVTALPRRLVTMKYARLPNAGSEQVSGMVRYEAQQYIPFPLDEVVLAHQIVSDDGDEMATILVAAARRSLISDVIAAFEKASLEVSRLSVSSLALAEHGSDEAVPVAFVHTEPAQLDLAVVSAGRVLFTRAVEIPAQDAAREADLLAREAARSLVAYQNEYHAQPVSRIVLTGPVASVELAETALAADIAMPIGRLPTGAHGADGSEYAVGVGLAIEGSGRGISTIDLRPGEIEERKIAARRRVGVMMAAGIAAVACVVGGVWVRKSIDASQAERARAEQQNRKMVAEENALKRIKDSHGKVARAYETVSGGLDRSRLVVDVVKQISDAVPAGGSVSLTQLAFERGVSVAIHGNAKSESAAMDLVLALQKTASLGEVRLAYLGDAQTDAGKGAGTNALVSKLKPGEKMSFIIACQWPKVTATRELVRPGTRVAGSRRRRGGTETGL